MTDRDKDPRPQLGKFRWRIGAGGQVVAEGGAAGWRLLVRGVESLRGDDTEELHAALRKLGKHDPGVAHEAFGVIVNCDGSWEDEYTEHHGEDALLLDDWLERISADGLATHVDEDGELYYTAE